MQNERTDRVVLLVISFLGLLLLCLDRDGRAPDNVYVWAMTGHLAGGIRERAGDASRGRRPLLAASGTMQQCCGNSRARRGECRLTLLSLILIPGSSPSQPCRPAFALRRFAVWQGEGVVVKERGCGWSKEERPFQLLLPIRYRFIIEDRGDTQLCIRKMGSRFETTSTFAPRGESAYRRAGDRKQPLS